MSKTTTFRGFRVAAAVAVAAILAVGGCNDPARDVGNRVRHVTVSVVSDQGITLDAAADQKQVVYVLLCAIRDEMKAADAPSREAAFDRQLAVCAPDNISARYLRKSYDRDEGIQRVVWRWAPTIGHYVDDFPKSWEEAEKRLVIASTATSPGPGGDAVEHSRVMIELASPDGDRNASAIVQFQLVREQGFWRVSQTGFVKEHRHLKASSRTAPADSDGRQG